MKQYNPSDYEEDHEIQALKEQIENTDLEIDLAEKNSKMFYRLWLKWSKEEDLLKGKQSRFKTILRNKLETLTDDNISYDDIIFCQLNDIDPIDLHYYKNDPLSIYYKNTPQ